MYGRPVTAQDQSIYTEGEYMLTKPLVPRLLLGRGSFGSGLQRFKRESSRFHSLSSLIDNTIIFQNNTNNIKFKSGVSNIWPAGKKTASWDVQSGLLDEFELKVIKCTNSSCL